MIDEHDDSLDERGEEYLRKILNNLLTFLDIKVNYKLEETIYTSDQDDEKEIEEESKYLKQFFDTFFSNIVIPNVVLGNHRVLFSITNQGENYKHIKSIDPNVWCSKQQGFEFLPKNRHTTTSPLKLKMKDEDLKFIYNRSKHPLALDMCYDDDYI